MLRQLGIRRVTDLALEHLGNMLGLRAAERIVVAASVLIFFWGEFAFISAASLQAPWVLVPGVAMITYGLDIPYRLRELHLLAWDGTNVNTSRSSVIAVTPFCLHSWSSCPQQGRCT